MLTFLDYQKVAVDWNVNNELDTVFSSIISKNEKLVIDFDILNIPDGLHEIVLVINTKNDVEAGVEELTFMPRKMIVFQVNKNGGLIPGFKQISCERKVEFLKDDKEIAFIKKGAKIAVVNPFEEKKTAVFFSENSKVRPLFFSSEANSISVFESKNRKFYKGKLFALSSPYHKMEDKKGKPLYIHDDFSGINIK